MTCAFVDITMNVNCSSAESRCFCPRGVNYPINLKNVRPQALRPICSPAFMSWKQIKPLSL